MLKADYEASLRESYITDASTTFIIRWKELAKTEAGRAEQEKFLKDPDKLRQVQRDQARFILHYLEGGEGLAFKVQKAAKYEKRELDVLGVKDNTLDASS